MINEILDVYHKLIETFNKSQDISHIIVHPETVWKIIDEVCDRKESPLIPPDSILQELTFMGIKIIQDSSVPENKVVLCHDIIQRPQLGDVAREISIYIPEQRPEMIPSCFHMEYNEEEVSIINLIAWEELAVDIRNMSVGITMKDACRILTTSIPDEPKDKSINGMDIARMSPTERWLKVRI